MIELNKNIFYAFVVVLLVSCVGNKETEKEFEVVNSKPVILDATKMSHPLTIVDVAIENENFTTLVATINATELVKTLGREGSYTVFAPTNDAFSKLPTGKVDNLLKTENSEILKSILTSHVVLGKFEVNSLIDAINKNNGKYTVETMQGSKIDLSLQDEKVVLTDTNGKTSTIVVADVKASNGVIHAIDAVMM